jgi:hypothetical protein
MEVSGYLPVLVALFQEPTDRMLGGPNTGLGVVEKINISWHVGFAPRFLGIVRSLVAILTKLFRIQL